MKNFDRKDLSFSLCGLNCALCTMKLDGYCPGCGGGAGNQSCAIALCSLEHGGYRYCFECGEYPCEKYNGISDFDSFITHRVQLKDMEKARSSGISAYHTALDEKAAILKYLLKNYNDGRRKTFFCLAVNLLELSDIQTVMKETEIEASSKAALKEKAMAAVRHFEDMAAQRGIMLKLRRKPADIPGKRIKHCL